MAQGVKLHVSGSYACFTRPDLKAERMSFDVITPSAARGILEAVHWKPAISWVIDAIHVLRPIRFQSLRRNEVGAKISTQKIKSAMTKGSLEGLGLVIEAERQQRATTLLVDVAYVIEAHFDLTEKAGPEDNPGKHLDIFNRRARKGQCFHQPCLGTREFPADFRLIEADEPMPKAIAEDRELGYMLWDIDHGGDRSSLLFRARLERGVMRVPAPGSAEIRR